MCDHREDLVLSMYATKLLSRAGAAAHVSLGESYAMCRPARLTFTALQQLIR